jgi:hypothetical protein
VEPKSRPINAYSMAECGLSVLLAAGLLLSGWLLFLMRPSPSATLAQNVTHSSKPFVGGSFEASGVMHVPGTDGVLFVDDNRPSQVLWMRLNQTGEQVGSIKAIKLGAKVTDPEAMTFDGSHFYIVGSQSKSKDPAQASLVRFRFDPQSQSIQEVETLTGLRGLLLKHLPELKQVNEKRSKPDDFNIEGLAWDAKRERLLIGLRSPLVDGQAMVIPLKLRDPRAAFSTENLILAEAPTIRLSLGGAGIRSLEYDAHLKLFQILSGSAPNAEKLDFKLWEWSGESADTQPREKAAFGRQSKPEGITCVSSGGHQFSFIVFDTSRYASQQTLR